MSACVETMMYVREVPWHGLGTRVEKAPTSAEALSIAGLDWNVVQRPVKTDDGILIPNYVANVRDTDNQVLGVVTEKYKVLSNRDAFAFTDALIDSGDVRYETCGSLRNGKTIWLLARMPDTEICEDRTERYLCFTNSHDGTGAVRMVCTNVRVVCANTLNIALSGASRSYSVRHMGNMQDKLHEAQMCLKMANAYNEELKKQANIYANYSVSEDEIQYFLNELFPTTEEMTEREKKNIQSAKDDWMVCYFMPDISKFRGSMWALVNASSDFVGHAAPQRMTKNFEENRWGKIMNGHPVMDRSIEIINRMMAKA